MNADYPCASWERVQCDGAQMGDYNSELPFSTASLIASKKGAGSGVGLELRQHADKSYSSMGLVGTPVHSTERVSNPQVSCRTGQVNASASTRMGREGK